MNARRPDLMYAYTDVAGACPISVAFCARDDDHAFKLAKKMQRTWIREHQNDLDIPHVPLNEDTEISLAAAHSEQEEVLAAVMERRGYLGVDAMPRRGAIYRRQVQS
jgi:hypothetical protein